MSTNLKKIYVNLNTDPIAFKRKTPITFLYRLILSMGNLVRAALGNGPGVGYHAVIAFNALRWTSTGLQKAQVYSYLTAPMDTFRYFEFDFFWKSISKRGVVGDYLDVSSPRLFIWRIIASGKTHRSVILNPDAKDLSATVQLFNTIGIGKRCEFKGDLINDLNEAHGTFDLVTCISVLEHIPYDESIIALKTMWDLVKPGGRLLLSIPCAATAFEEFINFNEYRLLQEQSDGYVFGQRFYDETLINEVIFSMVGQPSQMAVYGEKIEGTFVLDRERKLSDPDYPFWRQSWTMASQYKYFERIKSMPGLGVVAFEFIKQ
jgi:SAM-dependent methyltransferase